MLIDTLSHQQLRFADEYLVDLNGAQAAIRAGYSENGARQQANRLLTNADMQLVIQERFEARQARVEIDQDYVLRNLRENLERCNQPVPEKDTDGKDTGRFRSLNAISDSTLMWP